MFFTCVGLHNSSVDEYIYDDVVSVLKSSYRKTTLFYRGSDQGGGVGGINYTEYSDGSELNYKIYNLRGDVIKTVDANKQTKSFSNYYAFGEYKDVIGDIKTDDYRANTKVEDDHNLLNDGKRFRQLEYGIFLTPDPLEYVDGYNPYIYCGQNPWGKWDPLGLSAEWWPGSNLLMGTTYDVNHLALRSKAMMYSGATFSSSKPLTDAEGKPKANALYTIAIKATYIVRVNNQEVSNVSGKFAREGITDSRGIATIPVKLFNSFFRDVFGDYADFEIEHRFEYEFLEGSAKQNGFTPVNVFVDKTSRYDTSLYEKIGDVPDNVWEKYGLLTYGVSSVFFGGKHMQGYIGYDENKSNLGKPFDAGSLSVSIFVSRWKDGNKYDNNGTAYLKSTGHTGDAIKPIDEEIDATEFKTEERK